MPKDWPRFANPARLPVRSAHAPSPGDRGERGCARHARRGRPEHGCSACRRGLHGLDQRTEPPQTIRVLRTTGPAPGTVQTVDFRSYVEDVLSHEYGASSPPAALRVGAILVKQYAWYHAMRWRGKSASGGCYDVVDTWRDQVFRPSAAPPTPGTSRQSRRPGRSRSGRTAGSSRPGYRQGSAGPVRGRCRRLASLPAQRLPLRVPTA